MVQQHQHLYKIGDVEKVNQEIANGKEALLRCKSCQLQPCISDCPSKEAML